ncbi:hypothetical protein Dimus_007846 [Dionaea muscipula]
MAKAPLTSWPPMLSAWSAKMKPHGGRILIAHACLSDCLLLADLACHASAVRVGRSRDGRLLASSSLGRPCSLREVLPLHEKAAREDVVCEEEVAVDLNKRGTA